MEANVKDGMAYSSVIHLEDDKEEKEENCEEPARKKAKTSNKRITSSKCPWKGLLTKVVWENYEQRLKQMKVDAKGPATPILRKNCTEEMGGGVKGPVDATPIPSGKGTDEIVQSTGKFWRQPVILVCNMRTHVTHLVRLHS
jgi:hypothetical protein